MPRSIISPVSKIFIPEVSQSYSTRKSVRITRVQPTLFPFQTCSSVGQDATEAFYGLHRHEVLERPQYKRLQIGTIQGEKSVIYDRVVGQISQVPYAEPTWLTPGYFSPYFSDVRNSSNPFFSESDKHSQNHREFQKAVRQFVDEVMYDDAQVADYPTFHIVG